MPPSLGSKTAIVTDASSGIGKSIATKFSEEGAHVHLLDSTDDAIALEQDAILRGGEKCTVHHCNVTEDLDRLYQVNVKLVYNSLFAVELPMKSIGGGVILNMTSVSATVGIPDRFAFCMTKGAVLTMIYSVALDYVKDGIRCNSISPGRVHTPFVDSYLAKNYPRREKEIFQNLSKTQPIGRMGTPEEIAGLATYLCSDQAAFITGTDFPIDGDFIKLKP